MNIAVIGLGMLGWPTRYYLHLNIKLLHMI